VSASSLILSPLAVDIITVQSLRDDVRLHFPAGPQAPIVVSTAPPAQHTLLELRYRSTADSRGIVFQMYYSVPNRESGP